MKRILALALPFCLLWAMVACVLVCAAHIEDSHSLENSSFSDYQAINSLEDDCCTITTSVGVRPDSPQLIEGATSTHAKLFLIERKLLSSELRGRSSPLALGTSLTQLCTLRI